MKPGYVGGHVFDGLSAPVAQDILGRCRHRKRNVVHQLLALERGDGDLFRERRDRENDVDGQGCAGFNHEIPSGVLGKALERYCQGVDAGGQAYGVVAVARGCGRTSGVGCLVSDRNRSARHESTECIAHFACDTSLRRLGVAGQAVQHGSQYHEAKKRKAAHT